MSQRRAIACTICAKAKTKCDKATPSCSRCTAKGLVCEPRSTRRTSDSSYRSTKKHIVSPKRFSPSTLHSISRHTSPRSMPSSNRHQLARAVSHMDYHTAVKFGQQRPDFAAMSMLTPLPSYTPQIIDECYPYSSSPEMGGAPFVQSVEKNNFMHQGRLTPPTPEPFSYAESLSVPDFPDQYMNSQGWSQEAPLPIGLGFENEIPGLLPTEADMSAWVPDFSSQSTPVPNVQAFNPAVCESPASVWPTPALSPPHPRAVPSLSISECSDDSASPNVPQEDWSCFQNPSGNIAGVKPITSTPYLDSIKAMSMDPRGWDENVLTRM